jgi:hypothetical protein
MKEMDCVGILPKNKNIYQMPDSAWALLFVTIATYRNTFKVGFSDH